MTAVEVLELIESRQYKLAEHPGDEHARGWNAGMRQLARDLRVLIGLAELKACDVGEKEQG